MKQLIIVCLTAVIFFMATNVGAAVYWPLRISSYGDYLEDQSGVPFLIMGEAAWSAEVMLTREQVVQYLDDRKAKGFTAVIFSAMEHKFSTNPPANVYGEVPFTNGENDWSVRNENYWTQVDYIIQTAKDRDMLVLMAPAYLG